MSVHVLSPGLLSTLQDNGRYGWRHLGVGSAGALDAFSHAVANRLVGNTDDAVAIEVSLQGPRLRFEHATRIALCGADIEAHVDGMSLPGWRPVVLPAGSTLVLGACRRGARASLAVAGGFVVPRVLGSGSTDLRGGFGGMRGRTLAAGDVLPIATRHAHGSDNEKPGGECIEKVAITPWWIDPTPDLDYDRPAIIHVLAGRDALMPDDALYSQPWRVAPASNRQGLRLEGTALTLEKSHETISEPVAPGTLQLPPDGNPIVLMADAQTHGGYPRIGHAIQADRPRLAQLRPGDVVRFQPCTPAQARRLYCEQRQRLARIALAITARMQHAGKEHARKHARMERHA